VDVSPDGSFELSKPDNTGGLINTAVATEQLLYEIHDPANYALPDVVCDFTTVQIVNSGENRVIVRGATGKAPSDLYKVCATYPEGFRCIGMLSIVGFDAEAKAQRTGEAILTRTRAMFKAQGLADYTRASIEVIGSETDLGPHAAARLGHEAMLRIAVTHADKKAASIFSREIAPAGTSYAPGTSGNFGMGRPNVTPLVKLFSCFVPKHLQMPKVQVGSEMLDYIEPQRRVVVEVTNSTSAALVASEQAQSQTQGVVIPQELLGKPLITIAHGRSGDKGDTSNVGIVARKAEYWPLLRRLLRPERVSHYLAHLVKGEIHTFELPQVQAFNLVMKEALDGGGMTSMRNDPLGKGMAQILLNMKISE